ncbi:MAG TPA: hypothetical protein VMU12_01655 [Candidatus Paceibacterota bacterium]|nr:hypothetical protein [Candidatus Paceibacterota bacterium]
MRANRDILLAAAGPVLGSTGGITWAKVMSSVYYLLQNILLIAGLAATGAVVYYGFLMATSRDNATQFAGARKGLLYAMLGAIIIFGVYTILATVRGAVGSVVGQ